MSQPAPTLPHLDMDLARTFVAICETGNFSRAAERVFRTPSAVSLQVKKLEETVGRPLFKREPRAVIATADGEVLLGYARKMLRLNDEAMARFLLPRIEGHVRLGVPDDSGVFAIPRILKRFASTHPQVAVDVRLDCSTQLRRRFEGGDLDVALIGIDEKPCATAEEIHREKLVWVGLKNGEAVARTPLPLAVADTGCWWRGAALEALDARGISYRIAYSSETCLGQLAAVEADLAIAPLPATVVSSSIVRIPKAYALPDVGTYRVFMLVREAAGPVAETLARHVADSLRDITGRGERVFA